MAGNEYPIVRETPEYVVYALPKGGERIRYRNLSRVPPLSDADKLPYCNATEAEGYIESFAMVNQLRNSDGVLVDHPQVGPVISVDGYNYLFKYHPRLWSLCPNTMAEHACLNGCHPAMYEDPSKWQLPRCISHCPTQVCALCGESGDCVPTCAFYIEKGRPADRDAIVDIRRFREYTAFQADKIPPNNHPLVPVYGSTPNYSVNGTPHDYMKSVLQVTEELGYNLHQIPDPFTRKWCTTLLNLNVGITRGLDMCLRSAIRDEMSAHTLSQYLYVTGAMVYPHFLNGLDLVQDHPIPSQDLDDHFDRKNVTGRFVGDHTRRSSYCVCGLPTDCVCREKSTYGAAHRKRKAKSGRQSQVPRQPERLSYPDMEADLQVSQAASTGRKKKTGKKTVHKARDRQKVEDRIAERVNRPYVRVPLPPPLADDSGR